ncbi:hypothetical protein SAMN05444266_107496 [Chitinophaga jiangningensis]|uniref:Uncharacterized protein n=1 Tax=Chitinophaga jiangningensis TaxID=1419482 RepID=A0A1M7I4N2_9BACT|nr:hypothetical protein [Chitinophaga jiangningensis]SHM35377.1 hypothetical protein SAMN05444266_107496 [Chitinophaga jiangningensis]
MKIFTLAFISAFLLLQACKFTGDKTAVTTTAADSSSQPADATSIKGIYSGDFGGSPIYITINYANGHQVAGYNIHKSLRRNLKGEMVKNGDQWQLTLNEPGDNQYDGKFEITLNAEDKTGSGKWTPNDPKATTPKTFKLKLINNEEGSSYDASTVAGYYTNMDSNSELQVGADGSVAMLLYTKINDSTYSDQAISVRGSWSYDKNDSTKVLINWIPNASWPDKTTLFNFTAPQENPESIEGKSLKTDSLVFTVLLAG